MRTKKVNRYWCEFCNKAGLSASHMNKHEIHCTMNPNRICRVCKFVESERPSNFKQMPLADLVAMLPVPSMHEDEYGCTIYRSDFLEALKLAVPRLETAAGECPACMMAALRQAKIPLPIVEGFSYTDRMKEIWENENESRMEREYG